MIQCMSHKFKALFFFKLKKSLHYYNLVTNGRVLKHNYGLENIVCVEVFQLY